MAVKMESVKCPSCGAALNIEEGRTQVYCSYCGSKVIIQNENEHIYRHIDEAGVKKAETDRIVELKKMELLEKRQEREPKVIETKIKISIILAMLGIIMIFISKIGQSTGFLFVIGFLLLFSIFLMWFPSLLSDRYDVDISLSEKARTPFLMNGYHAKNYAAVEAMLTSAGFTNVRCIPCNDLKVALLIKPGMVSSITINGKEIMYGGRRYPKDAAVIISYHSLMKG